MKRWTKGFLGVLGILVLLFLTFVVTLWFIIAPESWLSTPSRLTNLTTVHLHRLSERSSLRI